MRWIWRAIARILLFLALIALPITIVRAQAREDTIHAVLSITPATMTVTTGDIVNVEVRIDDIIDLYGADIQLAFDPSTFEVLDADPGTPGTQITLRDDFLQPDFVNPEWNKADNSAGTVLYLVTQLFPTAPASGSGVLFEFDLMAIGSPGEYPLTFTNHDLSAVDGPIEHSIEGAIYSIEENGQVLFNFLPLIKR